jgi:hypothetical protein
MSKYCCHSPWCEDDEVCRCDQFEEYEREEKREKQTNRLMWIALILCGGYIFVRIIISLIWKI